MKLTKKNTSHKKQKTPKSYRVRKDDLYSSYDGGLIVDLLIINTFECLFILQSPLNSSLHYLVDFVDF